MNRRYSLRDNAKSIIVALKCLLRYIGDADKIIRKFIKTDMRNKEAIKAKMKEVKEKAPADYFYQGYAAALEWALNEQWYIFREHVKRSGEISNQTKLCVIRALDVYNKNKIGKVHPDIVLLTNLRKWARAINPHEGRQELLNLIDDFYHLESLD